MRTIATSIIVAAWWLAASAVAQNPNVRTTLNAPGDVWIGQRVVLVVELLAPGVFAGAPTFDLPDPPGMLLIPPSGSPVVSSEDIGGVSYTVQRHELSIVSQRPGEATVPGVTVRLSFKRNPLDQEIATAVVQTAPVRFNAKMPPGAEKLGHVISAHHLTAVESWKPEPGEAKAGDAFTRTIVFTAPDIPAMAFPPFPAGTVDGLGIYPKAPEVLDQSDRGNLRGERRDSITYVCQRAGKFVIPAARLTWFDLDTQQLQRIDFPARVITVAPNPAMSVSKDKATTSNRPRIVVISIGAGAGICLLGYLCWKLRRFWWRVIDPFRPVHLRALNPTSPR